MSKTIKLKDILVEEQLNEMDYQKWIPIQITNLLPIMAKMKDHVKKGNYTTVKREYMKFYKMVLSIKKSIDNLEK